jgi:hypothetical protein
LYHYDAACESCVFTGIEQDVICPVAGLYKSNAVDLTTYCVALCKI